MDLVQQNRLNRVTNSIRIKQEMEEGGLNKINATLVFGPLECPECGAKYPQEWKAVVDWEQTFRHSEPIFKTCLNKFHTFYPIAPSGAFSTEQSFPPVFSHPFSSRPD